MKIDQYNYEIYLLDYIEGHLDPPMVAELEDFLAIHPELRIELESFEEITIVPEDIKFHNKKDLKKFAFNTTLISDKNFEDFCIAFGEHLLSPKKINELFSYIEHHQHLKKELDYYKEVYLQPHSIVYDQKQNLYKQTIPNPITKSIVRWSSLAAGILALAGIYSLFIHHNRSSFNKHYTHVYIEDKLKPKTPIVAKHERISVKNDAVLSGITKKYKVLYKNNIPKPFTIDTLNIALAERDEEISYIPCIAVKSIENPFDLSSSIKLDYAVYNPENENIEKQPLLKNLTSKIAHKINLLKNSRGKISLFKVAQLGITGINQLTNSNMQLSEKTDKAGNITALSFESGLFEYHKVKSD